MYLTRLVIDQQDPWVRRDLADCQRMHRTVMRAFPPADGAHGARACFGTLYRIDRGISPGTLTLYVQSRTEPCWSHLPAGYLAEVPDNPACRPLAGFYDSIAAGDIMEFRLRANVTRKIDSKTGPDGKRRHGRRVELRRTDDQLAWLARHAEKSGFAVIEAAARPGRVTGVHPCGSLAFGSVYFLGRLRVVDSERFRQALIAGIGPAKAYGFGLLSVAPA